MTEIERATEHLRIEYERACTLAFVRFPLGYALYKTWRWADEKNREREGKENDV